jgi:dolichol-phosphate mannosyltransferase
MDADFSHDPAYLPKLLAGADVADLVLGSRYVMGGGTQNWGFLRQVISRGGSLYARAVLGVGVRDLTGGFKCFRRETLLALDLATVQSEGYAFQIELTYRALCLGLKVLEIPIVFADRRVGKSKMSRAIVFEAIPMVLRLRAQRRAFMRQTGGPPSSA